MTDYQPSTVAQRERAIAEGWCDCGRFVDTKTGKTMREHWRAPDGTFWSRLPDFDVAVKPPFSLGE